MQESVTKSNISLTNVAKFYFNFFVRDFVLKTEILEIFKRILRKSSFIFNPPFGYSPLKDRDVIFGNLNPLLKKGGCPLC